MLSVLYVVLVFALVLGNGFFVASEFALVGVRRSRIEMLAASGSVSARRLLGLLDNLNAYISATQLGSHWDGSASRFLHTYSKRRFADEFRK